MLSQYAPPLVVPLIFCTHQYRMTVHHCYLCDRRRRGAQTSCLSGIEFPPHRTISILQGVLLVLSPNYHTVAIWLLNNCYYACRFKWEKYGTEHDYEWTNVVLNIIYCIYLQEAHSSQQTFWRNRFIMEYFRHEFKSTLNQSINQSICETIYEMIFNWAIQRFQKKLFSWCITGFIVSEFWNRGCSEPFVKCVLTWKYLKQI